MKRASIAHSLAAISMLGVAHTALALPRQTPLRRCAPDAVVAGTVCMDKYEASVWRVPDPTATNKGLVKKIQQGRRLERPDGKGGATQLGTASDDYAPCADNGQSCTNDIYAVSLPRWCPSAFVTWFQAQEACENARKRLPTSAEWQVGANGTPGPGPDDGTTDCNTASTFAVSRRARAAPACRRAAPSTWWATSPSGWPTGFRSRPGARKGPPASATTSCASSGRARPRPRPARSCAAATTSFSARLPARSPSAPRSRSTPSTSSAFAAPASRGQAILI